MEAVTLRNRREVLRLAGGLAVGALLGPRAAGAAARSSDRAVALYSINTGERLDVEYFQSGRYRADALDAVSHLLRDHRTGETHVIDPTLLDQVFVLRRALDTRESCHVVCGYRSPETNAVRRRHHEGVASHSFHLTGRAIDVFVPDRDLRNVRAAALAMYAGGVGYYPDSGFVHLDTGPVRTW
jgi:uncharacterized protein YcbK (DUF882 family)